MAVDFTGTSPLSREQAGILDTKGLIGGGLEVAGQRLGALQETAESMLRPPMNLAIEHAINPMSKALFGKAAGGFPTFKGPEESQAGGVAPNQSLQAALTGRVDARMAARKEAGIPGMQGSGLEFGLPDESEAVALARKPSFLDELGGFDSVFNPFGKQEVFRVPTSANNPPPNAPIPGMPDFSAIEEAFAKGEPVEPEGPSKSEQFLRALGGIAGGLARTNTWQRGLALGSSSAIADFGAQKDLHRSRRDKFNRENTEFQQKRAGLAFTILNATNRVDAQQKAVEYENHLRQWEFQKDRARELGGQSKIVGSHLISVEPSEDGTEMVTSVTPLDQLDTIRKMMAIKVQAQALGASVKDVQTFSTSQFGTSTKAGEIEPRMRAVASVASQFVLGIIGEEFYGPARQEMIEKMLESVNMDAKTFAQQHGPDALEEFLQIGMYYNMLRRLWNPLEHDLRAALFNQSLGHTNPNKGPF